MRSATIAPPEPVRSPATLWRCGGGMTATTPTLWRCGGRQCPPGECDHGEELHRQVDRPGHGTVAPPLVHEVLDSAGSPLPDRVRREAEHRIRHDFADVRVHTDPRAAESAKEVGARAYTVGKHVVFGEGAFSPGTTDGRRTLFHELFHTMQQPRGAGMHRSALRVSSPHDVAELEAEALANRAIREPVEVGPSMSTGPVEAQRVATANPEELLDDEVRTSSSQLSAQAIARVPLVQRDLAIEPPRPEAEGRALTPVQMQAAITFNNRVVTVIGEDGLRALRDVLGISPEPAVVDEDFVNAVVRWQAINRLTQDGQLGPTSARPLFREIGAEGAGRGELETGPTYVPSGTINPPVVGGNQQAPFRFRARFKHEPASGIFASCCEARQHIRWDAASAAALPGGIPHAGFPAGTAANTWIEDRNGADTLRYGHRSGRHGNAVVGNQYLDTNGRRNQAFGHRYEGRDFPGGPDALLAGSWRFMVSVIDVCNGNARLGEDFVRINW